MSRPLAILVALAALGLGCARKEETQAYSSEMSKEMPKPTTTKPDFPPPKGFVIGTGAKGGPGTGAPPAPTGN